MRSIKEKLSIVLLFVLTAISVAFILVVLSLASIGIILTSEAYTQIAATVATLLVIILTLGLRLIDDTQAQFEKTVKPRLIGLLGVLGKTGLKKETESCNFYNLPMRSKDLRKISRNVQKYGRFFVTVLYPKKQLEDVVAISYEVDKLASLGEEAFPYWGQATDSDTFLRLVSTDRKHNFSEWRSLQEAEDKLARLEKEKKDLVAKLGVTRETILQKIEQITSSLDEFIEAN